MLRPANWIDNHPSLKLLRPRRSNEAIHEYVDHIMHSRCDPLLKFITAEVAGVSAAEAYFRISSAISMLEEVRERLKQRALSQAVEVD